MFSSPKEGSAGAAVPAQCHPDQRGHGASAVILAAHASTIGMSAAWARPPLRSEGGHVGMVLSICAFERSGALVGDALRQRPRPALDRDAHVLVYAMSFEDTIVESDKTVRWFYQECFCSYVLHCRPGRYERVLATPWAIALILRFKQGGVI